MEITVYEGPKEKFIKKEELVRKVRKLEGEIIDELGTEEINILICKFEEAYFLKVYYGKEIAMAHLEGPYEHNLNLLKEKIRSN